MRSTKGGAAGVLAAGTLAAGVATGLIDGPTVWNLVDAKNPNLSAQVGATGARGPYAVSMLALCQDGVTIFATAFRITQLRNEEDGFAIENAAKGIPARMRIQAPGVGYSGFFEPTRSDRCSLRVEVRESRGSGRARLDCRPGEDGFAMTPFPSDTQIEAIRSACADEEGISVHGTLKRVKVRLNGTATEQGAPQ